MSDGTLRALGVLIALFQAGNGGAARVPLIGIEEPEVALHPAALGALLDSLREASESKQILITSHSADLLDSKEITPDELLSVVADKGVTKIAPLDEAGRTLLRKHLYTPGELLRLNQIAPDPNALQEAESIPLRFFGESAA
jgi:predicted ATPase